MRAEKLPAVPFVFLPFFPSRHALESVVLEDYLHSEPPCTFGQGYRRNDQVAGILFFILLQRRTTCFAVKHPRALFSSSAIEYLPYKSRTGTPTMRRSHDSSC